MSKLAKFIEELQKKQKEVSVYEKIPSFIENSIKDAVDEETAQKVIDSIKLFCDKKILQIENSINGHEERPKKRSPEKETEENVDVYTEDNSEDYPELKDPLKFVVKYKDWEGKEVMVRDGFENWVNGTVIGAAFPGLKIRFENGTVLPVSPRDVKQLGGENVSND